MPKFRGIFGDTFFNVEAKNEEEACILMGELLLERVTNTPASQLITAWQDDEIDEDTLQQLEGEKE